jgi:hypothetical protein
MRKFMYKEHGTCSWLSFFMALQLESRVSISEFVYHYVLLPGEPPLDGHANVWPCIVRPSVNPSTTRISGTRDPFCFRTAEANVMAVRELSCRCICFLQYRWKDCKNEDAGEWRYVTMSGTPAAMEAEPLELSSTAPAPSMRYSPAS